MEITNLGNGLVKLNGRSLSMVVGPSAPKNSNVDVIALTQAGETSGDAMVIDSPGEYEVAGALITGIPAQLHVDKEGKLGTIYVISSDDVTIAVLANIAPTLSNAQVEAMGGVDVLVVPVGGHGLTLDAQAAAAIVAQVEPKVVIPVHYDDGTTYDMPQDKVDAFIKELGMPAQEASKYKATVKDLPAEMVLVVLKYEAK